LGGTCWSKDITPLEPIKAIDDKQFWSLENRDRRRRRGRRGTLMKKKMEEKEAEASLGVGADRPW